MAHIRVRERNWPGCCRAAVVTLYSSRNDPLSHYCTRHGKAALAMQRELEQRELEQPPMVPADSLEPSQADDPKVGSAMGVDLGLRNTAVGIAWHVARWATPPKEGNDGA